MKEREKQRKEGREGGGKERRREEERKGNWRKKRKRLGVILNFALEHYYFESNPDILFILESSRRHS